MDNRIEEVKKIQGQVNDYVLGALRYPLKDKGQLVSMVILHFDIPDDVANTMVDKSLQIAKNSYLTTNLGRLCQPFPQSLPDEEIDGILKVLISERAKNICGAPWGSVVENLEWLVAKTRALLQPKMEELKAEIEALHRERKGEVWYWQGDGEDKLESLTCPVLIEAQELKDLIEEARRQERERICDMSTGQESKASDKGNVWVRFNEKKWQALKVGG